MSKHKERTLNDLYNVTFTLSKPKITPLLRGSHRMQGPFVEPICNFQTNTVSTEVNKEAVPCSQNQSVGGRLFSGTCNVCSTPCSSCFPTSQNLMESKVDELSGETGMVNSLSFSVNDVSSSNKTRKCEVRQSNQINSVIRTSSSSLSFSANAEVKANARTSDVSSATSDGAVLTKLKDPKSFEGLDDNMSCIVRGNEANKLSSFSKTSEDKSSLQCSSTSSGKTISNQTSAGCVHVKNEADDGSPVDHSRQNDSSGEENNKAPTDATSSRNGHSTGDCSENNHSSLKNDVASEASGDLHADTCPQKDDQKNVGSPVLSDTKDALQSHQMDESDDSDIEEQDVKVCDICGDAGREDLLAICCKCTDGAEHTYCMREMLQKVPERDWMCEECKFDEEMKNRKEDKSVKFDGNGKNNPTGQIAVGDSDLTIKRESKPPDFDSDIASDAKTSRKRRVDDTEVSSAAKKQALDPVPASPKTLSPNKLPALSRGSSFKNTDKGKLKSANQISSGGLSVHDNLAWGSRLQSSRGALSKSNSFSSLAKRKVQPADEGPLPKHKLVRESIGLDAKESSTRSMSKSMSFKFSSRNNISESKVKMLSPKFSPAQDKGQMLTKERNQFERKNSFRSDRSPSTSVPSKTDQRSAFRGDPSPLSSSSNIRDSRTVQLDSKPVSLLKSSGSVACRTQDISVHSDEAKKQTSHTSISTGATAANKIGSSDHRPDQSSARDDSSPNSYIAERPTSNTGEGLLDGLPQPSESKNVGERIKESSGKRLKHTGTGTKSLFCQKCKGSSHLTDSCTVDGSELSASDVSAVRNSRETPNGTSNLKAAIEAAMLRKPGICRKNRVVDQSDDLAVSNTNSETTAQDIISGSSSKRILSSNEDGYGVSSNSMTGSHKQEISSLMQLPVLPAEALTGAGNPVPILLSDGRSSTVDLHRYSQAAMSILSRTAIPGHEYIWQGAFEVQKSGRTFDLCDGIQAHLSSCASPNVLDAVNKFPQKVLFNEVSRLSTWPIQFQEYGVKEDNIALFFFAKDIGSYERCYKILLENMIRNDTALKANLQGVELLIFPSNLLPEKSQRWNMMFFLWGVFRVKKVQATTGKPSLVPQDIPKLVMPFPENIRCLGPVDNVTSGNISLDGEVTASKESGCPLVNGNVDSKASQICQGDSAETKVEHLEPGFMSSVSASHMNFAPERRHFGIFQVGDAGRECKVEVQSSSAQAANSVSYLSTSEPVPVECGSLLDKQKPSGSVDEAAGHMQEKTSVGSMEKGFCRTNGRKFEINLEDEYKDEEASETSGSAATEPTQNVLNNDVSNHLKRPHSVENVMQSADSGVNQATRIFNDNDLLVEEAHYDKKLKTSIGGSYGNSEQTSCSSDDLLSRMHGSSYGSYLPDSGYDEALSKAPVPECSGSAARYFFPVDPNPGKASSMPWQMHHPDNDRLSDRVPNLELALGGKSVSQTRGIPTFLVGKVDKQIIQDQGGETHPPTPGIPPFLVGKVDKKVSQDPSSAKETVGVEEVEDVSASLSLSLSFPFPGKEQQKGSVSQTELAIPETRRGNTSLLFFGGLGNK